MLARPTSTHFFILPCAFYLLLLAAATVDSMAQTTDLATTGLTSPVANASTAAANPISIDIAVADKLGHHVSGLKPEDFTLLDNKQTRNFIGFHEVDARNATADPAQIVIVIDMINTGFSVVARERQQLGEFLKQDGGRLAYPTSIAVFTERGLQIEKTSTTDGNALFASLDVTQFGLRMTGRAAGYWGAVERMNWSLDQLRQLTAYEATQRGRKLVFFISPGWPIFPAVGLQSTDKQLKGIFNSIVDFSSRLREARVTLYVINPFEMGVANPYYYQIYLKGVPEPNKALYANLALQVLAVHSGGTVQVTGTDVKGGINNALRDANAYYTLTFDPTPSDTINEYHDLNLRVDRPNTTVRTTTGYYAGAMHDAMKDSVRLTPAQGKKTPAGPAH